MATEWRKAIPEARDKLQSKVLVWVVGPVLTGLFLVVVVVGIHFGDGGRLVFQALGVSLTFGVLVWARRAATPVAAVFGAMICAGVTIGSAGVSRSPLRSGLFPLFALFILTFVATRAGKAR